MDNLPKLPHAVAHILLGDDSEDVFTADQMQAYARAAVLAERERCAMVVRQQAEALAENLYGHPREK